MHFRSRCRSAAVLVVLLASSYVAAFTPGTTRRRISADNFDYRSELTAARSRYADYLIRSASAWRRALYGGTDAPSGDAAVRKAAETWAAIHGAGTGMSAEEGSRVREKAALEALLSRASDGNVQVESLGGAPLPREDVLLRLAPLQSGYRASTGRGGPQSAPPNDPKADAYLARLQLPWLPEALSRVTLPDPRLQAALHPGAPDLTPPYIRPDLLQAPGQRGDIALPHMPWPLRSSLDAGAGWGAAGWDAPLPGPAGPDGRPPMLPPGGYPYAAESLPWAGVPRLNLPALAGERFADAGADTAATLAAPWAVRGHAAAGAGANVDVLARLAGVGSGLSPALLAAAGAARDGAAAAHATGEQGAALNRFLGLTDGEAGATAAAASVDAEAASRAAAFPGLLLQGSAAAPAESRSLAPAAANAWMHVAAARQAAVGAAAADLASITARRHAAADSALGEQLARNLERAEALQHRIPRDEEHALAVEQQQERRAEARKEGGDAALADADAASLGFRVPNDAATLAVDSVHHNAGKGVDVALLAGLPPRVRRECEANPSLALCLDPMAAATWDKAQAAAEDARRWQGPARPVPRTGMLPEDAAERDAAAIAAVSESRTGAIEAASASAAAQDGGAAGAGAGGKRLRRQAAA